MNQNKASSCGINGKESCCCSSEETSTSLNLKLHWDNTYTNSPEEKLGWFETDLSPMIQLISKSAINKNAAIINIGAGSTTLVDELILQEFTNIIATDISNVALQNLEKRVSTIYLRTIEDDLTNPSELLKTEKVDLWIDRAVLHFFTEDKDQDIYFNLLKYKVKPEGFVILAEFNLQGATKCSGLSVKRYNTEMFQEKLGNNFKLIESFDYSYFMPSGDERAYVYSLFQKTK